MDANGGHQGVGDDAVQLLQPTSPQKASQVVSQPVTTVPTRDSSSNQIIVGADRIVAEVVGVAPWAS